MTSEAIPHVTDPDRFMAVAQELVHTLSFADVHHEFQDPIADHQKLKDILEEAKVGAERPVVFITPEAELYSGLLKGERVVEIDISRVANIAEWKTKGHSKHFPSLRKGEMQTYKVFLDSVAFTGRSLEEVHQAYGIDLAVFECLGKHAPKKLEKIVVKSAHARDLSSFDAVWHLDDFVQPIRANGKDIKPSEFLTLGGEKPFDRGDYWDLMDAETPEQFREELKRCGIKLEQTSPNLFLELARPGSYLGRSFCARGYPAFSQIPQAVPLLKELESLYLGKRR